MARCTNRKKDLTKNDRNPKIIPKVIHIKKHVNPQKNELYTELSTLSTKNVGGKRWFT